METTKDSRINRLANIIGKVKSYVHSKKIKLNIERDHLREIELELDSLEKDFNFNPPVD